MFSVELVIRISQRFLLSQDRWKNVRLKVYSQSLICFKYAKFCALASLVVSAFGMTEVRAACILAVVEREPALELARPVVCNFDCIRSKSHRLFWTSSEVHYNLHYVNLTVTYLLEHGPTLQQLFTHLLRDLITAWAFYLGHRGRSRCYLHPFSLSPITFRFF